MQKRSIISIRRHLSESLGLQLQSYQLLSSPNFSEQEQPCVEQRIDTQPQPPQPPQLPYVSSILNNNGQPTAAVISPFIGTQSYNLVAHALGLNQGGNHEVERLPNSVSNLQAPPVPWDSNGSTQSSKLPDNMPVLDSIPPLGSWPYGQFKPSSEPKSDDKPETVYKLPPGGLKPSVTITEKEKEPPTWEKSPERNQPKTSQNGTKPVVNESVMAGLWDKFLRQQVPTNFVRSTSSSVRNLTTVEGHPMLRRSLGVGYPNYLMSKFPSPLPKGYRTNYFAGRLFDLSWRKRRK